MTNLLCTFRSYISHLPKLSQSFQVSMANMLILPYSAHQLRERGWVVPAYTMAPHSDKMKMLRVVVREDFTRSRCDALIADFKLALQTLDALDAKKIQEHKEYVLAALFDHGHVANGVSLGINTLCVVALLWSRPCLQRVRRPTIHSRMRNIVYRVRRVRRMLYVRAWSLRDGLVQVVQEARCIDECRNEDLKHKHKPGTFRIMI